MPDDHTLDATGERLDLQHLDPERPERLRREAQARAFQQLPPGPLGRWGRRNDRAARTVRVALTAGCVLVILALSRLLTGQWIHAWTALAATVTASCVFALLGWQNRRRP